MTGNAASTQPPRELAGLCQLLAPGYENVHRGQPGAWRQMTARSGACYDTIAQFTGAPGREAIALYKNTAEAVSAVMYWLLTRFRDGDNVATTLLEHNPGYVPWRAMCAGILPWSGRRVQYRLARSDPGTGELDLGRLAWLIDARTKLACCAGAPDFPGTRVPLAAVRALADARGDHVLEEGKCRPSYRAPTAASRPRSPNASACRARTDRLITLRSTAPPAITSGWRRTGCRLCSRNRKPRSDQPPERPEAVFRRRGTRVGRPAPDRARVPKPLCKTNWTGRLPAHRAKG